MYRFTENAFSILRVADGSAIQVDMTSKDYQEYLAWTAAGNVPLPALVDPRALARTELAALERDTMMNRGMREYLLVSMQDLAMRQAEVATEAGHPMTAQDILADNSAWNRLVEINKKASELRAKLSPT